MSARAAAARRCPHCGWIESKAPVASSVGAYPMLEQVFREPLSASWRVGERLTLID